MNEREAIEFIRTHGIVLMAARGPVESLAEAIAGGPVRGSWWGHPKSGLMFRVFEAVRASDEVLVCRLVGGKVTFVHERLWPALVRLADRLPRTGLAAVREEHTAGGAHRAVAVPFPRWVPKRTIDFAKRLSEEQAVSAIGPKLWLEVAGKDTGRAGGGRTKKTARRAR